MEKVEKRKIIKIAILLSLFLLFFYFFVLIYPIITPFIIALILAYLLDPLVDYLEGKGIGRTWGILIIYCTLILSIGAAIFYGLPSIIVELNKFIETIPLYVTQLEDFISAFQRDYSRVPIPESIREVTDETIKKIEEIVISIVKNIVQGIIFLFTKIFDIILAPILAFYLLKDFDNIKEWLLQLIPAGFRKDVIYLGQQMDKVLKSFFRGHLIVALFVGALTTIGLSLIGMEFALVLGFVAGVFNIIPYFGPLFGIIPAVALALLQSKKMALYVLIIMTLIQQVEGNIISPKILGKSVGLNPLLIILVLLAGGHLFGVLGMIFAVPVTGILKVLITFILKKAIEM
ncbi:MAG: AI-2E family transporter [Clostridia bacterium]|nr:AI-2E family transporter [Clostridia bacterium]